MKQQDGRQVYIPIVEAAFIGLVAGLSAIALSAGVKEIGHLRVHLSEQFTSFWVLPLFGFCGGTLAGLLVQKVAPEASGSGIPQVRAALDRVRVALNIRIAIVKLLGGTIALGSGLFMGREGPTVQLGAALAAPLSKWIPTTIEHRRQLIAAGAGAGLTAAFNAPLAGVVFVCEELLKETRPSTILLAISACAASALVLNAFWPPSVRVDVKMAMPICFTPADVPYYLLLGVVTGVLGALFNNSILKSLEIYRLIRIPMSLKVGLAGLLSGAIIAAMPEDFRNYAYMRELIVSGSLNWLTVVLAFLEFYLLTLIAYGSGAPGGLFAPSLVLGSTIGYLCGCLEQHATGSASISAFALVGMGSFFAAVARVPLTAIVITFELTANFQLLTPLMISCVLASTIADFVLRGGLYDHLMRWNGIYLGSKSTNRIKLKARDLMHSALQTISSSARVKEVLPALSSANQRGYPVVDRGHLVGVLSQADLGKLSASDFSEELLVSEVMSQNPVSVSPYDTVEDVLLLFSRYQFTWVPVTYHDKFVGVISQSDLVQAIFSEAESAAASESESGSESTSESTSKGVAESASQAGVS